MFLDSECCRLIYTHTNSGLYLTWFICCWPLFLLSSPVRSISFSWMTCLSIIACTSCWCCNVWAASISSIASFSLPAAARELLSLDCSDTNCSSHRFNSAHMLWSSCSGYQGSQWRHSSDHSLLTHNNTYTSKVNAVQRNRYSNYVQLDYGCIFGRQNAISL